MERRSPGRWDSSLSPVTGVFAEALNVNVFRRVVSAMSDWRDKGVEIRASVIGKKASAFFKRHKIEILSEATGLGDAPELEELIGAIKVMMDGYQEEKIDRLFIVSNEFVNTMTQTPGVEQVDSHRSQRRRGPVPLLGLHL